MADIFNIAGQIHSTSEEGTAVIATEVKDERMNKKQNVINQNVDEQLNTPSTGLEDRVHTLEQQASAGGEIEIENTPQGVVSGSGKVTTANAVRGAIDMATAYFECSTAGATAAKVISGAGVAGFVLPSVGGSIKIKMTNRNTAASGVTLNINSTGAKSIYYNGAAVNAGNTWDDNEIIELFFDGTKYLAYNVAGNSGDGVFDISAYNLTEGSPTPYADLAAALGTNGANVPQSLRKGGMSVKFIQSSDNKYVQYRYMETVTTAATFTNVANWQGVDDEPTVGSENLVKSGGVFDVAASGFIYDVSLYHPTGNASGGNTYTLNYILDAAHIDTLLPKSVRRGGMSIKFLTDENVYVQYRYTKKYEGNISADSRMKIAAYWQGINEIDSVYNDGLALSANVSALNFEISKQIYIAGTKVEESSAISILSNAQQPNSENIFKEKTGPVVRLFRLSPGVYKITNGSSPYTNVSIVKNESNFVLGGEFIPLVKGTVAGQIGDNYYTFSKETLIGVQGSASTPDMLVSIYATERIEDSFNDAFNSVSEEIQELSEDMQDVADDVAFIKENKEVVHGPKPNETTYDTSKGYQQPGRGVYTNRENSEYTCDKLIIRGVKCTAQMQYRVYLYSGTEAPQGGPANGAISSPNWSDIKQQGLLAASETIKDYTIELETPLTCPTTANIVVMLVSAQPIWLVGGNVTVPEGETYNSILWSNASLDTIWESTWNSSNYKCYALKAITSPLFISTDYFNENIDDIVEGIAKPFVEELIKPNLSIQIPDTVYAVVDTELNLWNDAISLSNDKGLSSPLNYQVRWSCSKGLVTNRCFRFTPVAAEAGNTYACSCYLYDLNGNLIDSKSFSIKVLAKNALQNPKNIVYFGDSLGAGASSRLYEDFNNSEKFTGTIPTMLGTRDYYGQLPHFEAVGGYGWSDYATSGKYAYRVSLSGITSISLGAGYSITISGASKTLYVREVNLTDGTGNILLEASNGVKVANFPASGTLTRVSGTGDSPISFTNGFEESNNPLWNDTTSELDVSQYKSLIGLQPTDKIDAVSFQFGINDNALADNLTVLYNYIKDLYDVFVNDNADCKVLIGLTTTAGNDVNGAGANYGATYDWHTYINNMYKIRQFYLTLQNDAQLPNVRVAPIHLELDRYYGYSFSTRQISQRYAEEEEYHNNYVHPGDSGYWQIADAYFATYIGVLTE